MLTRAEIERAFEERFWFIMPLCGTPPKRRDKIGALREYVIQIGRGYTFEELEAGAVAYAAERQGQDPQFTQHARKFLHNGGWMNEAAPAVQFGVDETELWKHRAWKIRHKIYVPNDQKQECLRRGLITEEEA